jgi:hypothetical protein
MSGRNRHGVYRLDWSAITIRAQRVEVAISVSQIKDAPAVQASAAFAHLAITDEET